jgi:hypothetical protein
LVDCDLPDRLPHYRQDEFEALVLGFDLEYVDAQLDSVKSTGAYARRSHVLLLLDLMGQEVRSENDVNDEAREKTRVIAPRR